MKRRHQLFLSYFGFGRRCGAICWQDCQRVEGAASRRATHETVLPSNFVKLIKHIYYQYFPKKIILA